MMARHNAYGDGQFKLLLISSARSCPADEG